MLDKDVFFQLNRLWGPLLVDLFASRLTCQCEMFYSWRPDPCAAATDAFLQDWSELKVYANPPWNLVGRVLTKVQIEKATVVGLVAPVWKAQSWYPMLLEMAMDSPRLFPWQPQATCLSSMEAPALAAWLVSGNAALSTTFGRSLFTRRGRMEVEDEQVLQLAVREVEQLVWCTGCRSLFWTCSECG